MRLRLIIVLPLFFVVLFSPIAQAKPSAATDCVDNNCNAKVSYLHDNYWRGLASLFIVSNPGFSQNGVSYFRELYMEGGISGLVEVGEVKWAYTGSGGICGNSTALQYFFDAYNTNGLLLKSDCVNVPSADINNLIQFQMGFYVTNGPGMWFEVEDGAIGAFDHCSDPCFVKGALTTYDYLGLQENMTDYVTGHQVWGSEWLNNEFQANINGNPWEYFGAAAPPNAPNPVQMYWHADPMGSSNNGGILYSCVYSSGSECTLGS